MALAGTYDCVTDTPLGAKKGVLTVTPVDDETFTGEIAGDLGTMEIRDGRIAGDTLKWSMTMTFPMKIELDCTATVDGDALNGKIKAGMFGTMAMKGTRRA